MVTQVIATEGKDIAYSIYPSICLHIYLFIPHLNMYLYLSISPNTYILFMQWDLVDFNCKITWEKRELIIRSTEKETESRSNSWTVLYQADGQYSQYAVLALSLGEWGHIYWQSPLPFIPTILLGNFWFKKNTVDNRNDQFIILSWPKSSSYCDTLASLVS